MSGDRGRKIRCGPTTEGPFHMSKEELVTSYLAGRISRRMFVRGLLGVGVSITAAVAYSDVLAGAVASPASRRVGAGRLYDVYDHYDHYDHYEPGGAASPAQAGAASPITSARPRFTG
jgi:hypothetical protein